MTPPPIAEYEQVEALASRARLAAGLVEDDVVSSLTIARKVTGRPVRVLPTLATSACYVSAERLVVIRELGPAAHFEVAHEVGHHMMRAAGLQPAAEEHFANYFAAALLMPFAALARVESRSKAPAVREHFGVSPAQLRLRRAARAHLRSRSTRTAAAIERACVGLHLEYRKADAASRAGAETTPTQADIEALATVVRRRAGVRGPVLAPTIAERALGVPLRVAPTLATGACLATVDGQPTIYIREIHADSNFDVAHELGHWALREIAGYRGGQEERLASAFAAAVLCPPPMVRRLVRAHGRRGAASALARRAIISRRCAVRRIAEVCS